MNTLLVTQIIIIIEIFLVLFSILRLFYKKEAITSKIYFFNIFFSGTVLMLYHYLSLIDLRKEISMGTKTKAIAENIDLVKGYLFFIYGLFLLTIVIYLFWLKRYNCTKKET